MLKENQPPLMIRGKGQNIKSMNSLLDERLKRCDLELSRVLRLDDQIDIYEVDFKNLKSIVLDKNVEFQSMVDELKIWNEDYHLIKNNKKIVPRSGYRYNLIKYLNCNNYHFSYIYQYFLSYLQLCQQMILFNILYQNIFDNSIKENLREIVNTKDRQVQLMFIVQLKQWYERQNAILQSFRPTTQSGGRVQTAQRQSTSNQNNPYSSMSLRDSFFPTQNMDDYVNHHRSKHSHLDPPEDRIKEYAKRDLVEQISTQGSRPATVMFNSTRPITQGSFVRPSTNQQTVRFMSNADMISRGQSRGGLESAQSQFQEGERLRSPGVINTSPWNYTGSFAFFQSFQTVKPSVSPQHTTSNKFQTTKFQQNESKELTSKQSDNIVDGDDNEQEEQEGEDSVEQNEQSMHRTSQGFRTLQPSRKAFHNDRNSQMSYAPHVRPQGDTKSTYLNYNPTDEAGEIRLENLWFLNRNKAVQEKREYEELENHIQTWSTNKGLVDQEIDKKNEITKHGSKFCEVGRQIKDKIPQPPLSENNYLQKEMTTEEVDDQTLFNNYIGILRLSKEEKQQMAHPSVNDESIYEIASKIDQQIRTPRTSRSISRNVNDFQEQMVLDQSFDQTQTIKSAKKRISKKSSEDQIEEKIILQERPKTMYINLREQIKDKQREDDPFINMEFQMKKKRLEHLRQGKEKIIGKSQTKLGEEADEEEVTRRKQASLQIYHRIGHQNQTYRPFTTMYRRMTQKSLKAEQLSEIDKVRKGYAKKGIKCSLKAISQSLSIPQGLPQASLQLPEPGSMLFVNPFDNFAKKKSKKK